MAKWASRGLRGSLLEELINRTNEKYNSEGEEKKKGKIKTKKWCE